MTAVNTTEEVRKISFSTDAEGRKILLGEATGGRVYAGRVYWLGGGSNRVAIKLFNKPLPDGIIKQI
ncbi:MAG: hypothetical protein V1658_00340, partial [Candidatus Micrarchaeota archaeon]